MNKTFLILFSLCFLAIISSFDLGKDRNKSEVIIPFEFVKNQILLEVLIEGEGPYNMIFDTGVTPSTIDLEIARSLQLAIDTSNAGLANGRGSAKVQLFPAIISNFQLGDLTVDSLQAVTLDHKFLAKALDKPLHGILGYSFIKDKIFKINYQKKEIHFFNSRKSLDQSLENKDYIKEKIIFQEGDIIPIIKNLKINGKEFIASLDTGSSLAVEIFKHHADSYNLEVDSTNISLITGAQGKAEQIKLVIDKFSLGDRDFYEIEGAIARVKNQHQLRQGNIGNRFMKKFTVSFDYLNAEVLFE